LRIAVSMEISIGARAAPPRTCGRSTGTSGSSGWRSSGLQRLRLLSLQKPVRGGTHSMDHKKQIKRFVLENFLFTDDENALANGDSLIQKGIVDSTGMLELISHLEETCAIKVENAEMIPANFDSIDAIGAFVARKLAA
jgi:acyl carrier protein